MKQLIDLCGVPIQINKIQSLQLLKRDYLFYPAYQEVAKEPPSFLKRVITSSKTCFQFVRMVPYGAILNEKETPVANSHEIKHFGESTEGSSTNGDTKRKALRFFTKKNPAHPKAADSSGGVAGIAADVLKIDTSKNRVLRVLTYGHHLTTIRLGDIPAKVHFLSGKISDVYQHDQIQKQLGEPIAPVILPVSTLVVTLGNSTLVFFGEGIDLENAEAAYHTLFETYNSAHTPKRINTTLLQSFSINSQKRNALQNDLQMHSTAQLTSAPQQQALADYSLSKEQNTDL